VLVAGAVKGTPVPRRFRACRRHAQRRGAGFV